jgi:hypothetical protein
MSSFDFSDLPPPLDPQLSAGANVMLRSAIEAAAARRLSGRRKAMAALDAASATLEELYPSHAAALCGPLRALLVELRELEAGGAAGEITRPRAAFSRRGDTAATIEQQARIVLALDWLKRLGVKPRDASRRIAAAGFGAHRQIESMAQYFRRDTGGRRREALVALWYELEITRGVDVDAASPDDVLKWLRAATA